MPDLFGGFFFGGPQGEGDGADMGFASQGMEGLQRFGDAGVASGSVWGQGQDGGDGSR